MVTSLEFINTELINVGEVPATTLQSLNGQRGLSAAQNGLFEVCTLAMWPWLRDEIAADFWEQYTAYLPEDTHRVLGVATGQHVATPVSSQELRTTYDRWNYEYELMNTWIRYYCVEGMKGSRPGVMCAPYPKDDYSKGYVKFRRWKIVKWPKEDNAEVPVPLSFQPLVSAKLRHNLAQVVGAEANVVQAAAAEYDRLATRLRSTLTQPAPTGNNMYRRQRV